MNQLLTVPRVAGNKNDRHLRIDHLANDLKGRAVRGGVVTLLAQAAKFVLQTGSMVILARMLTPADFGLVAMVAFFTGFISLFKDLGLSVATIQRSEITHKQVSALFWINVGLSIVLMLISMAMAPVVASFYGEPLLTGIMLAFSATFVLGGLATQHLALIRRQMRYRSLAMIEVVSLAAGVAVALLVAWLGGRYWALIAMIAASALVNTVMAWIISGWRPGRFERGVGIRSMLAFGGNLTMFNTTNYFGRNSDGALIGWIWGAGPLGLYNRAYSLLMLPLNQINAPLSGVVIPALSRLQDDPPRYSRFFCRIANLVNYATLPVLAVMAALSAELIAVALGAQWSRASAIYTILAVAAIGQPLLWAAAWMHVSLGRTHRLRNWGLVTDPMFITSFLVGLPWGPMGVAISYAACVNLLVIPGMLYAVHESPVRMRDLAVAVWCPFLFSGAVFIGAWQTRNLFLGTLGDFWVLVCGCLGGLTGGLLFFLAVPNCRQEITSLFSLVSHLKKNK